MLSQLEERVDRAPGQADRKDPSRPWTHGRGQQDERVDMSELWKAAAHRPQPEGRGNGERQDARQEVRRSRGPNENVDEYGQRKRRERDQHQQEIASPEIGSLSHGKVKIAPSSAPAVPSATNFVGSQSDY